FSKKSTADSCTRTANPAVPSRNATARRTCSSSSIRWITALVGIVAPFEIDRSQRHVKDSTPVGPGFSPELPTMRFDDRAGNGKPHTHALCLAGDKGLEKIGKNFRRNSRTGIRNIDTNHEGGH